MEEIFFQISAIIILGTVFATVARFFKQPMIPAYILAGIVLGPALLHVIEEGPLLDSLAKFGIAFLLFLVGIELDLRKFFKSGWTAIIIGFAQMGAASGIGYAISIALGFSSAESFFLGVSLGFSSTIVVMKILGERKEVDTLYGQLSIGLMLTQDFIALAFLLFFDVYVTGGTGPELAANVGAAFVKGTFLIVLALMSSRYILSHVFRYFARSPELLFLGSISWCLVFAILSILLGFSVEVGALLAGVSLSFVPYSIEIGNRIKSLRDFFIPIFFSVLGAQLIFSDIQEVIIPTAILSALVLFFSPLLVTALLLAMRYRARTSFQTGMAISQISEFSFVVVSLGLAQGIIQQNILGMVALIGLITMTVSTYFIYYIDSIYPVVRPIIKRFERSTTRDEAGKEVMKKHVIVFGYHTMGVRVRQIIERAGKEMIAVDHNPDIIKGLEEGDLPFVYGSMIDDEVLEAASIEHASFLISTVHDRRATLGLLAYVKQHDIKAKVIVTAFHIDDALEYYEKGAQYVIYPAVSSAEEVGRLLKGRIGRLKTAHWRDLRALQSLQ